MKKISGIHHLAKISPNPYPLPLPKGETMLLSEILDSTPKNRTVEELNTMLDTASISISWYGQRMVSIEGFEGSIDINLLVRKYFEASPKLDGGITNLKERVAFYTLWEKVEKVCKDKSSLNNTWIYQSLVPTKEVVHSLVRPTPRDFIVTHMKGINFPTIEEWSFSFHPTDFKQLWPSEEPVEHSWYPEKCVASYEMVKRALGPV